MYYILSTCLLVTCGVFLGYCINLQRAFVVTALKILLPSNRVTIKSLRQSIIMINLFS